RVVRIVRVERAESPARELFIAGLVVDRSRRAINDDSRDARIAGRREKQQAERERRRERCGFSRHPEQVSRHFDSSCCWGFWCLGRYGTCAAVSWLSINVASCGNTNPLAETCSMRSCGRPRPPRRSEVFIAESDSRRATSRRWTQIRRLD